MTDYRCRAVIRTTDWDGAPIRLRCGKSPHPDPKDGGPHHEWRAVWITEAGDVLPPETDGDHKPNYETGPLPVIAQRNTP